MDHRVTVGTLAAALLVLPIAAQLMLTTSLTPLGWQTSHNQTNTGANEVPVANKPKPGQSLELSSIDVDALVDKESDEENVAVKATRAPKAKLENVQSQPLSQSIGRVLSAEKKAMTELRPAPAAPLVRKQLTQQGLIRLSAPTKNDQFSKTATSTHRRVRRIAGQISDGLSSRPVMAPLPVQADTRERFEKFSSNTAQSVAEKPVSTFSIDVDTASYAFVRKSLEGGQLPNTHAVRVEEMINYFSYNYPAAETTGRPFKPTVVIYPTPWNANTKLMHIGIKGHEIIPISKPRSNLVFLLDVSGSMNQADKLPLLKNAFRLLVNQLDEKDTVSIVTYAGRAATVLEPTKVTEKHKILAALDRLTSGGSTAGAQGIKQAYALAEQSFDKTGVNRVILATDGDFNVGIRGGGAEELHREKTQKRCFPVGSGLWSRQL